MEAKRVDTNITAVSRMDFILGKAWHLLIGCSSLTLEAFARDREIIPYEKAISI